MALDVYVMPLWRFKAGDFASPVEEILGIKPTVIALSDLRPPDPWYLRWLSKLWGKGNGPPPPSQEQRRSAAVQDVNLLKTQLTAMVGTPIDWSDEGLVHHRQQFHEPVVMRAFAAWLDHREVMPEFTSPPEDNYYKHPVWSLPKPLKRRFPVLVEHSLHNGYLLPVPFEGVYKVEPFKVWDHWEFFHFVSSSQTMMREVTDFLEFLATLPSASESEKISSTFGSVRWYAEELQRMCSLSIEHRLPVIFHG